MLCRLQISHHRKRSSFSLLSVSTLSALLRTAFFVVVALLKPPSSLILSVKRFCGLPAGRAGTFTFSQVRSKSSARKTLLFAISRRLTRHTKETIFFLLLF